MVLTYVKAFSVKRAKTLSAIERVKTLSSAFLLGTKCRKKLSNFFPQLFLTTEIMRHMRHMMAQKLIERHVLGS